MRFSRRDLLRLGSTLAATGVLPARLLADNQSRGFAELSRESFEGCVNTPFEAVDGNGKSTWLTLMSVQDLTNQTAELNRSAWEALPVPASEAPPHLSVFTVRLYGPPDSLKQGTYTMNQTTLGTFPLFVVPDGYSAYTAIVNRLVDWQPPVQGDSKLGQRVVRK